MSAGTSEPPVDADVIVVGAGIAGTVAALQLARAGREVVLIERGAEAGSKNLSGGLLQCAVMDQVFPGFADVAPVERRVVRHVTSFLTPTAAVSLDVTDPRLARPVNAVTVLRARLDAWLVAQCEEAGVLVMPGVRVDALVREEGRVVGVRAGEDVLRAHVVVAADGVNSFLARDAGLRPAEPTDHLALGIKSVVALPPAVIEDRFGVRGDEGAAWTCVGDATVGIPGGGFVYTNRTSVSVGVVVRLDALAASGRSSSDVHDHFLAHPRIAPLLEGGELLEYGCHLTIEDGPAASSRAIACPGLLLVGDAAGLTLNTGLALRGMDLAAASAIAAASVIDEALDAGTAASDLSEAYRAAWDAGVLGPDLRTYADAPGFLSTQRLYTHYGPLLANVLHDLYAHDGTPRRPARRVVRDALRRSPVRLADLVRDAWRGVRAL